MIIQKLKYDLDSALHLAEKYFAIISVMNNLELANREIQLMAYTAVRGNIGSATSKKEFCKEYDSSMATVGNIISRLTKEVINVRPALLVKEKKLVVINKALALDFEKSLKLEIVFEHAD